MHEYKIHLFMQEQKNMVHFQVSNFYAMRFRTYAVTGFRSARNSKTYNFSAKNAAARTITLSYSFRLNECTFINKK